MGTLNIADEDRETTWTDDTDSVSITRLDHNSYCVCFWCLQTELIIFKELSIFTKYFHSHSLNLTTKPAAG